MFTRVELEREREGGRARLVGGSDSVPVAVWQCGSGCGTLKRGGVFIFSLWNLSEDGGLLRFDYLPHLDTNECWQDGEGLYYKGKPIQLLVYDNIHMFNDSTNS